MSERRTCGARRARSCGESLRPVDCITSCMRTRRSIFEIAWSSTTATICRLSCAGEGRAPTNEAKARTARRRRRRRTDGESPKVLHLSEYRPNRPAATGSEGEAIVPYVLESQCQHDGGARVDGADRVVVAARARKADGDAVVPVVHPRAVFQGRVGLQIAPGRAEKGPVVVDLGADRAEDLLRLAGGRDGRADPVEEDVVQVEAEPGCPDPSLDL